MGSSPDDDGVAPPDPPNRAAASGVRTEHDLRVKLRQALERNTTFERALREAAAYAYGRRDIADLRKLKAVLSAAGFPDPNVKRGRTEEEPTPPDPTGKG
jgi:hypothetical protein